MTAQDDRASLDDMLKKLEPDTIRANLVRAGLFLTGWELLKAEIQDKVKSFYLVGFDETGLKYSASYEKRVLSRHKSVFEASLLWLVETNAITEVDAEHVRRLRTYRNEVAHELPKMLVEPGHDVDIEKIRESGDLLKKLGVFWGRIEVDISPDFDGQEVVDSDIRSGVSLLMDLLIEVAEDTAR